jgi:hypothetical protein
MIIEFTGQSCAGKSTLSQHLDRQMRRNGVTPGRLVTWRTHPVYLLSAVADPRLLAWCLLNPRLALSFAGRQLLGAAGKVRLVARTRGVVLLDEGPLKLQTRWSLRGSRFESLLEAGLPAPDLLVIVTCDSAERLVRLRREGRPSARGLSDEEILRRDTGERFARRFAVTRGVPLVEVDTSTGSDPLAALDLRLRPWYAAAS